MTVSWLRSGVCLLFAGGVAAGSMSVPERGVERVVLSPGGGATTICGMVGPAFSRASPAWSQMREAKPLSGVVFAGLVSSSLVST